MKDQVTGVDQQAASLKLLRSEAAFREKEDLILVGAYAKGSDPQVDAAIQMREPILNFLRQAPSEHSTFEDTRQQLSALSARIDAAAQRRNVA